MDKDTNTERTIKFSSPIRYQGNLILIVLCLIFLLPLGLVLVLKNATLVTESSTFQVEYHGSWGWLMFWAIVCFPIAILLLIFSGADIIETKSDSGIS